MKLYHSSNRTVEHPDVSFSRDFLDFGKGFYLTSLEEQAISYGNRFIRRGADAWLNTYDFVFNPEDWKILQFERYDMEWLNFVTRCRKGEDDSDYDMVVGGIANDKVIRTLDLYFNGDITAEAAIGKLKYEKPNNQYCIRSQRMIEQCLNHKESRKLCQTK